MTHPSASPYDQDSPFSFGVCLPSLRLGIGADDPALVRLLARYYTAFDPAPGGVDATIRWRGAACMWGRISDAARRTRVSDSRARPVLTAILANRLAAEANPAAHFFHANVLVRGDGRGVLLAGASGAGKSTLAGELVRRGFRLLAEDLAIVADGSVLPFPRAAAVRAGAAEDEVDSVWFVSDTGEAKVLLPPDRPARDPLRVTDLAVVALRRPGVADPANGGAVTRGWSAWLCHWDAPLGQALEGAMGVPAGVERDGWRWRVAFPTIPDGQRLAALLHAAEAHGSYVLHTAADGETTRWDSPPARVPTMAALPHAEGVRNLLRARLSLRPPDPATTGHGLLVALLAAFRGARFHELLVGGTPEECARLVEEAVGNA